MGHGSALTPIPSLPLPTRRATTQAGSHPSPDPASQPPENLSPRGRFGPLPHPGWLWQHSSLWTHSGQDGTPCEPPTLARCQGEAFSLPLALLWAFDDSGTKETPARDLSQQRGWVCDSEAAIRRMQ